MKSVGELSHVCSQIVLKCLYLARIGRPDILWSVNKLARSITKCTRACDKRLNRLISYIHHTREYKQYCHVGNTAKQCRPGLFQDSDFAGDIEDSKSTSGGTLCVFGSHTFVPRSWMCKKQTSVSHSYTESEIISLDAGLRLDGFPALDLWDLIVAVLHGNTYQSNQERWDLMNKREVRSTPHAIPKRKQSQGEINDLDNVDFILSNVNSSHQEALLCVCVWIQRSSDQGDYQGKKPDNETRIPNPQSCICYSIESIWTPKSKSNTLTPRTNSQTSQSREISHVMNGIMFCVCPTCAISVLPIVLKWCRRRTQEESGEERAQRSQGQWCVLIARAPSTLSSSASAAAPAPSPVIKHVIPALVVPNVAPAPVIEYVSSAPARPYGTSTCCDFFLCPVNSYSTLRQPHYWRRLRHYRFGAPVISLCCCWGFSSVVIGSLHPLEEFDALVYNQIHQEQIVAGEPTQHRVGNPAVPEQVVVQEIPQVPQVVDSSPLLGDAAAREYNQVLLPPVIFHEIPKVQVVALQMAINTSSTSTSNGVLAATHAATAFLDDEQMLFLYEEQIDQCVHMLKTKKEMIEAGCCCLRTRPSCNLQEMSSSSPRAKKGRYQKWIVDGVRVGKPPAGRYINTGHRVKVLWRVHAPDLCRWARLRVEVHHPYVYQDLHSRHWLAHSRYNTEGQHEFQTLHRSGRLFDDFLHDDVNGAWWLQEFRWQVGPRIQFWLIWQPSSLRIDDGTASTSETGPMSSCYYGVSCDFLLFPPCDWVRQNSDCSSLWKRVWPDVLRSVFLGLWTCMLTSSFLFLRHFTWFDYDRELKSTAWTRHFATLL